MMRTKSMMSCLVAVLLFTSCDKDEYELVNVATPVTQSVAEFRASVNVESPQDIQESGKIYSYENFILVGDKNRGIHIIDNRIATDPQAIGFINIPLNNDMSVKNDILYADSGTDIVVFDISDMTNITQVGRANDVLYNYFEYPAEADRVNWEGYDYNGVIVDWVVEAKYIKKEDDIQFLANSEDSAFDGSTTGQGGSLARFKIVDDYLYAVDDWNIRTFDITTLAEPNLVHQETVSWLAETIFNTGDKLFIGSTTGMFIYDISNAAQPTYVSEFLHATFCDPVVVDGDYAYVTLRAGNECPGWTNFGPPLESQLNIIDISNIANPELESVYLMDEPYGLGIKDEKLFICDGDSGLKVYDKTDVNSLQLLDHFENINTFDVIPLQERLVMIGNNTLYQYKYNNQGIELLSTFSLD